MRHHLLQRSRARRMADNLPGRKRQRQWLPLCLVVLIAACSTSEPSSAPELPATEGTEPGVTAPTKTVKDMSDNRESGGSPKKNVSAHSVPPELMQRLIDAVAAEAGVTASEVKLERAEKTTFRDSSLDCPQPDMGYAQVLVNGYWVVFHVGREEFDLRVTEQGKFSRCKGSTKRAPIRYDDT